MLSGLIQLVSVSFLLAPTSMIASGGGFVDCYLDDHNITWNTLGKDSSESMPIGNGDIGLNIWVEEDGDLLFYIGKTDAWSENARLLKLGRVRIKLTPNPFTSGSPFRQTLKLREGAIEIQAGKEPDQVTLRVWVDANHPVIRVEAEGQQQFALEVKLELWRTAERTLESGEMKSAYGMANAPHPVIVYPDTVLSDQKDRVLWFHHNRSSIWSETLEVQGMGDWAEEATDPLLNLTFGGLIKGEGLIDVDQVTLKSEKPQRQYAASIYALTSQTETEQEWLDQLEDAISQVDAVDPEQARMAHEKWWDEFWNRSWIFISGGEDAEMVTRAYILQRFVNACGGRGAYPVKFNGSIFNVDGEDHDADYRAWGGPYWFQNTRLIYWPMIASGDFDLMMPMFQMHLDMLSFAEKRTQVYFGHSGIFYPETMYFWGAYANDNYGWDRAGKHPSHVDNQYIRYYYSGALELLAMMLDYYSYTVDNEFGSTILMPLVAETIAFYDQHYSRGEDGKIEFEPAQALETWWKCVNPMPDIAGLKFVLGKLLNLPENIASAEQRKTWQRLLDKLPVIPKRRMDGKTILAPAQSFDVKHNIENPELYAVFPYRLYGVGKPDLEMARLTFEHRLHIEGNKGHDQDDIHAAYLGLVSLMHEYIVRRFSPLHQKARFPVFWHCGYDWLPDQCHGGVGLIALQAMLMQAEDEKIILFPAWPAHWDVNFKLCAPYNTTVEGVYRKGKLEQLRVTPEERAQDVIKMGPR